MHIRKQDPPFGLAHFTVLDVHPHYLIMLAARHGFATVGLRLHPAFPGSPYYELPIGSSAHSDMRRRLEGEGIGVHDIEFVVIDETLDVAALAPMFEAAHALGAKRVSACGEISDMGRMADAFGALCDLAGTFGLGVDLEAMGWRTIGTVPLAAEVVRRAARSNGGVLIDALHLDRTGGSPSTLAAIPGSQIVSAQLCDAGAIRPTTREALITEARGGRALPCEGTLPLVALMAALPSDVVLSVEVPLPLTMAADERARISAAAMRNLLARCREAQS